MINGQLSSGFANNKGTFVQTFQGLFYLFYMSCDARKPVFGVFEKVKFKPACSATDTS